jgi:hypothetical protein
MEMEGGRWTEEIDETEETEEIEETKEQNNSISEEEGSLMVGKNRLRLATEKGNDMNDIKDIN